MNPFKSGLLYLLVIISIEIGSIGIRLMMLKGAILSLDIESLLGLGDFFMLVPALIFVTATNVDIRETFAVHKLGLKAGLITIPYVLMMMPMISMLNAISMFFTENVVASMEDAIVAEPFWKIFLVTAVFVPFVEEFIFRGAIYWGLRQSGRVLSAILLQAVMFGFMHMNFNQLGYAIAAGVAFGFLREVTGSIWPGFFGHMFVNGSSLAALYLTAGIESSAEVVQRHFTLVDVVDAVVHILIVAVLTFFAERYFLRKIAEQQTGGRGRLFKIFHHGNIFFVDDKGIVRFTKLKSTITVPAVAALAVAAYLSIRSL